jgi:3',5'-cyclic AMP phosphodiesterase CpdA
MLSCKKFIEYSPNEVRLSDSEKSLNARNIARIEAAPAGDSFQFAVIGDTQRSYDELEDFVNSVNQRKDVSFVVVNGDITDFGQAKEYQWVNRTLEQLHVPYVAVIGNHDMLANGRLAFHQMFGPNNFSFSHDSTKFICLNSCSREYGYDGTVPDLNWLQGQLSDLSGYTAAFVICHVPPFHQDFDQNLSEAYNRLLVQSGKVHLSIHGHTHTYSDTRPYGKEIEYLVTGATDKRHYVLITVRNDAYEIERVEY